MTMPGRGEADVEMVSGTIKRLRNVRVNEHSTAISGTADNGLKVSIPFSAITIIEWGPR